MGERDIGMGERDIDMWGRDVGMGDMENGGMHGSWCGRFPRVSGGISVTSV